MVFGRLPPLQPGEARREPQAFGAWEGYGPGEQSRDFVHAEDVAAVNLWCQVSRASLGIFNCGTGRSQPFARSPKVIAGLDRAGSSHRLPLTISRALIRALSPRRTCRNCARPATTASATWNRRSGVCRSFRAILVIGLALGRRHGDGPVPAPALKARARRRDRRGGADGDAAPRPDAGGGDGIDAPFRPKEIRARRAGGGSGGNSPGATTRPMCRGQLEIGAGAVLRGCRSGSAIAKRCATGSSPACRRCRRRWKARPLTPTSAFAEVDGPRPIRRLTVDVANRDRLLAAHGLAVGATSPHAGRNTGRLSAGRRGTTRRWRPNAWRRATGDPAWQPQGRRGGCRDVALAPGVIDLTGQTRLEDAIDLLSAARLAVCNDTVV